MPTNQFNTTPVKVYLGVKAVIIKDNCLLILKRSIPEPTGIRTFWDLPGGRIASGESLEAALIRELHEELPNLTSVKIGSLLQARKKAEPIADGSEICFLYYQVEAEFADKTIELSEEHSEYQWASAEMIRTFADPISSVYASF